MKILFLLENLSYRCGPTVNILLNVIKCLACENEVHALVRYDNCNPIDVNKERLFNKVYKIYTYETEKRTLCFKETNENLDKKQKMKIVLKNPDLFISVLDRKYNDESIIAKKYISYLEEIVHIEQYDIICGVANPYYLLRVLGKIKCNSKKVGFQLDPYTYNYAKPSIMLKRRKKIEKKVLNKLDLLFAASFVYDEIIEKKFCVDNRRIIRFELPGIDDVVQTKRHRFDDEYVHFIFIGQLYNDIRNPEYMFKLFERLPQNYRLHIVGGGSSSIEKYQERLGDRLINHGWVSGEEATEFMYKADILVNLNNTILNQLPSKLFEYISTGKPILNICKSAKCLSLEYTDKYPGALDVSESLDIEIAVNNIIQFVNEKKGILVEKDVILKNFKENTNEYFIKKVEDNLRMLCVNNKKV